MSDRTRTEYAFDFGDELDDFTLAGGMRDDAEALRRSAALLSGRLTPEEIDLYRHKLVSRTLIITEGDWTEVTA